MADADCPLVQMAIEVKRDKYSSDVNKLLYCEAYQARVYSYNVRIGRTGGVGDARRWTRCIGSASPRESTHGTAVRLSHAQLKQ